jgi:hypothetical protein
MDNRQTVVRQRENRRRRRLKESTVGPAKRLSVPAKMRSKELDALVIELDSGPGWQGYLPHDGLPFA